MPGIKVLICGIVAVVVFFAMALAYPGVCLAAVAITKHNLGAYSPGTVKSTVGTTVTTEICIFCHTPHNSNPSGALWNKADPGSTYTPYDEATMVAASGQPTGASKLCLSCHDGTIAIGSLLNLPGAATSGTLAMEGVTIEGKLSSSSTAYIGTELRDDHPISFLYSESYPANIEIKDNTLLPTGITLDASGMVQCTSCHDPHGSDYSYFLTRNTLNGAICTACHTKRYWDDNPSVHRDSTVVWTGSVGTDPNPWHIDMGSSGYSDDTPLMHSCLTCHRSHGGAAGKTLLKGVNPLDSNELDEEWTCLSCHNGKGASKNIQTLLDGGKTHRHPVMDTYGKHAATRTSAGDPARESASTLDYNNRHSECSDCHNPHAVKSGNHTVGGDNGNIIGNNLLGGWGVRPNPWPSAGYEATTYIVEDFDSTVPQSNNLEGYLCIKCHSYYGYSTMIPNAPSNNADNSTVRQSDITRDFNPSNMGFHPTFAQGRNQPLSSANPNWSSDGLTDTFRYVEVAPAQRTGFYAVKHTSRITCTDCHGPDSASNPKGPHGSNNKWVLRSNELNGSAKNLCYNCHRRTVYGDEDYVGPDRNLSRVSHPPDDKINCPNSDPNQCSPFYQSTQSSGANTGNNSNKFGILCLTCHGGAYAGYYVAGRVVDTDTDVIKGVHGGKIDDDSTLTDDDPLGYRLMNGACVHAYKRSSTVDTGYLNFRSVTPTTDKVCNYNFTNLTISTSVTNYSCTNITDCN
ncbi:MAG: hypothetical protein HY880_04815 [Deltaproteobacteria bacterium]|nr:hypothetical protein [Deltaproteobacteria bacterium]